MKKVIFLLNPIFSICGHIQVKSTQENQDKTHHLFLDFKAASDNPVRDRVYPAMSELGMPAKLNDVEQLMQLRQGR